MSAGKAGVELVIVSNARVTNTVSEGTENRMGTAGATSCVQVMLDGLGSKQLVAGGVLTLTLEVGLRCNGSDAER